MLVSGGDVLDMLGNLCSLNGAPPGSKPKVRGGRIWGRKTAVSFCELSVFVGAKERREDFGGNVEGEKRKRKELDTVLHRLLYSKTTGER